MNNHLAIIIITPAFHAPFARDSTRVTLHRTRQIPPPAPSSSHSAHLPQKHTARLQPPPSSSTPPQQASRQSRKHPLIAAHTNQVNNILVASKQHIKHASHAFNVRSQERWTQRRPPTHTHTHTHTRRAAQMGIPARGDLRTCTTYVFSRWRPPAPAGSSPSVSLLWFPRHRIRAVSMWRVHR